MPEQSETNDPELVAIAKCLAALRPLPEASRSRAIAYITERLATEAAHHNGSGAA